MEDLELRKELELEKIQKARQIMNQSLECGLITTNDIFNLLKKDKNYAFIKTKNYKELLLKQIIMSPFVLCDQEKLDIEVKKILPMMLQSRCQDEIEELEMMQELGYISEKELKQEKQMMKFVYYLSSEEGRQILKCGHAKNVKDNVLRKIKR